MRKRTLIVILVCAAFVLTTWGDTPPRDELWKLRQIGKDPNSIAVMTRNVYFGTDVDYVMGATSMPDLMQRVAQAIQWFYSTDIYSRAEEFADEIARGLPNLVGLQEVATINILFPDATTETYNFRSIIEDAIAGRGLDYQFVEEVEDTNIWLPFLWPDPAGVGYVQLIDHDVVLARHDVGILDAVPMNFLATLPVPGLPIEIVRGFVSVKAKVGHKTYRFVNTHLEPDDLGVRQNQAFQLIEELASETLPTIIVGDLNTPAPDGITYQTFLEHGYVDSWTINQVRPRIPGNTSGHDPLLRNTEVDLEKRIDFIMVRSNVGTNGIHNIGPVFAYVVGDELNDRFYFAYDGLNPWLWPSDHAGVVALLRIPVLGK
jgi:endonuclease/exonuclease/phosphatase family metal-dependent hydrolase